MTLLLDTHTLLWFLTNDPSLSARARTAIENPENVSFVSAASLWEVAIKCALGKLKLPAPYAEIFPRQLELNSFVLLPITPCPLCQAIGLAVSPPRSIRPPSDRPSNDRRHNIGHR
jgi:PIN domain nuclease of toxin-antitoxin system